VSSPYASAMGRLTVRSAAFLPKETFLLLAASKDLTDVAKILEGTAYSADLASAATLYQGEAVLEAAVNRLFVRRCRGVLDATPFAGKSTVAAYLRRFDLQNIGLILSAKAQDRKVSETDAFLISSRDVPAGLFAGAMTLDDFRQILAQPTLEAVVQQLVKFGYGGSLLAHLDEYGRTKDIFPLLKVLDQEYYAQLLKQIRYFQGDEWNLRLFVRSEIDVRNALLLLKGKEAKVAPESLFERFIEGGALSQSAATELYQSASVPELVEALKARFPAVTEGLAAYQESGTLTGFEVALTKERAYREILRMRSFPLSGAILFTFLMRAELERSDLRRVIYGRLYGVAPATIQAQLVVPRLKTTAG
jgi:V/A-type H+/Na+-transporting ATPase subunit C